MIVTTWLPFGYHLLTTTTPTYVLLQFGSKHPRIIGTLFTIPTVWRPSPSGRLNGQLGVLDGQLGVMHPQNGQLAAVPPSGRPIGRIVRSAALQEPASRFLPVL